MEVVMRRTLIALVLVGFVPIAIADELLGPVNIKDKTPFSLGAAIVYKDKPYRSYDNDEKWQPAPLILFEGERFYFRGNSFGWKFINQDDFEFSVRAEVRGDGYESSDSPVLTGMDDRDPTLDGGVAVRWRPGGGAFSLDLTAVGDLTDEYDGYEVRAGAGYVTSVGPWALRLGAHVVFQNEDLVDYYYGVRASEARPGRPTYIADEETNFRLQAITAYTFGESAWTLYVGGRYEFLGDEISDSPIVGDDTQWMGMAGFTYTFK
jgi:outer membrane protein